MLVSVICTENANIKFDEVIDYKLLETDNYLICAVIIKPVSTRTQRNSVLEKVGNVLLERSGKDVYVSADLDVYCGLGKDDVDTDTLVRELVQRGTILITPHT